MKISQTKYNKISLDLGMKFDRKKAKLFKQYCKKVDKEWKLYRSKLERYEIG